MVTVPLKSLPPGGGPGDDVENICCIADGEPLATSVWVMVTLLLGAVTFKSSAKSPVPLPWLMEMGMGVAAVPPVAMRLEIVA